MTSLQYIKITKSKFDYVRAVLQLCKNINQFKSDISCIRVCVLRGECQAATLTPFIKMCQIDSVSVGGK